MGAHHPVGGIGHSDPPACGNQALMSELGTKVSLEAQHTARDQRIIWRPGVLEAGASCYSAGAALSTEVTTICHAKGTTQ